MTQTNPIIEALQPYPFEKLRKLHSQAAPPSHLEKVMLSIGEPQHPCPEAVMKTLSENQHLYSKYAATKGLPELRQAIAQWCTTRFSLQSSGLDEDHQILPVNGTREALFSFTQAVVNRYTEKQPYVLMPNPCYQIYEGAALLAGAEPYYLPCYAEHGFKPNLQEIPEEVLEQCQLMFVCTPGNPTGATLSLDDFKALFELADRFDFIIASDECYSELYFDEAQPPLGILDACAQLGRHDYRRCVAFNSLSKRSNLAGLRSGFVAGDAALLQSYFQYRTYHGCTLPVPAQLASITAWGDEQHVIDNRSLYRQKYQCFTRTLADKWSLEIPAGSFYLWAETPIDDAEFAKQLYAEQHIVVLPGQYLSRPYYTRGNTTQAATSSGGHSKATNSAQNRRQQELALDPGKNRVRMALVATVEQCQLAAERIQACSLFS